MVDFGIVPSQERCHHQLIGLERWLSSALCMVMDKEIRFLLSVGVGFKVYKIPSLLIHVPITSASFLSSSLIPAGSPNTLDCIANAHV